MPLDANIPRLGRALPLVGHLPLFRNDRLRLQRRLATECGDLGIFRIGPVEVLAVSSPSAAHEVLVDNAAAFKKSRGLNRYARPLLGDGLLTSEAEVHKRQRKLLAPAFTHKRIGAYAEVMARETARLVDALPIGDTVDAAAEMMRLTLAIVGRTLFNADLATDAPAIDHALPAFMQYVIDAITSPLQLRPEWPLPRNRRMRRAVADLDAIVYRLIAERRASGRDEGDVLSMLLLARDDENTGMTDRQIRDEAMTLVLAGHETTANAMAWSLSLLADHPDAYDRLVAEAHAVLDGGRRLPTLDDLPRLPFALAVMKEAMRLHPPAYVVGREALAPVTIAGHTIPARTSVLVNIYGMHHRGDLFPDPERFRPERFVGDGEKTIPRGAYLPFGGGPRVCIGNHFALMEGQIILATLASRVRFARISAAPPVEEPLITLRPRDGLPMRVTAARPATRRDNERAASLQTSAPDRCPAGA
jgi:cytochrome P450